MLTEFIYQWNPFNLCGIEVKVEDLICNPLKSSETLRQDYLGRCRRIEVPSVHSPYWKRFVYWLQKYLNKKGHLEAIDKLISHLHEKLLEHPPTFTEKLQEFNVQADKLYSLMNDYGFVHLKEGNPAFVESRLEELKQHAYSIFADFHRKQSLEEEEARKKAFTHFNEDFEHKLDVLSSSYLKGLQRARLMIIASSHLLKIIFKERVQSLQYRLNIVQELQKEIADLERNHQGKFTIPFMKDYLRWMRTRLINEVRKIGVEAETVIRNLVINYHISPFKEDVKLILYSIQIDPNESFIDEMKILSIHADVNDEIERIQMVYKSILY